MLNRVPSLAAFALLVVFGLTAYAGANILGFKAMANRVWFGPADQPLKSVLNSVSGWTNTSGVATPARSLMLDIIMAETPHDYAAIEGALEQIAAGTPTSTSVWQVLAEVRKARGASIDSVLAAFRMSSLTGSHEGYFMLQRALFGLKHWNELPEQDRRTVVRDLVATVGSFEEHHRYREILTAKPESERNGIRTAILESGLASKDVLQALGM